MAAGSYERKMFVGGAPAQALSAPISDVEMSIVIDGETGWPDASVGPFVVVIDRNEATEEKVLISGRTGTTLTVETRGYDNTTPFAHSSGASIEHSIDASTIDQANRLANLLDSKADVFAYDGSNVERVEGPTFGGPSDTSFDGHVLQVDVGEATGLIISRPIHIVLAPGEPDVNATPRIWFDETTGLIRPSDGVTWLTASVIPLVADTAARDALFGNPPPRAGVACLVGTTGSTELQVWDGTIWQRHVRVDEAIPKVADTAARDALYPSPTGGEHVYITSTHRLEEYRDGEWILINQKITVSDTAPSNPKDGDVWIQPIS